MEIRFPMIGGTDAEKQLKALVELAMQPENHFRFGKRTAGEHSPLARKIQVKDASGTQIEYRVVFTITEAVDMSGKPTPIRLRHASVSLENPTEEIDDISLFTICHFLGFTGSMETWILSKHPKMLNTRVAMQPLENCCA